MPLVSKRCEKNDQPLPSQWCQKCKIKLPVNSRSLPWGYFGSPWHPVAQIAWACTACRVLYQICHTDFSIIGTRGRRRLGKTWSEFMKDDVREYGLPGIDLQDRDAWRVGVRRCLLLPTPSNWRGQHPNLRVNMFGWIKCVQKSHHFIRVLCYSELQNTWMW